MEEDVWNRARTVRTPEAARVLADDGRRDILMRFASGPRTLSEVAGSAPKDVKRLHHQVAKLCAAGLMTVAGTRARKGRAMKLYQAVGDTFFVPSELLPQPFTDDLSDELRTSLFQHGFRSGSGMLFGIDAEGRQRVKRVEPEPGRIAVIDLWMIAQLAPGDVPALKEELRAVLLRYERKAGPGTSPHLIHAAAAPRLLDRK